MAIWYTLHRRGMDISRFRPTTLNLPRHLSLTTQIRHISGANHSEPVDDCPGLPTLRRYGRLVHRDPYSKVYWSGSEKKTWMGLIGPMGQMCIGCTAKAVSEHAVAKRTSDHHAELLRRRVFSLASQPYTPSLFHLVPASSLVFAFFAHFRLLSTLAPAYAKLPAFYLLDAICKNVYEPYARLFTPVVVRLFLDTYELVDQNTRQKMDEMLLTWRTGAPNGRELFGVVPQLAIERQIWGGESTQNGVRYPRTARFATPGLIANVPQQSSRGGQPGISTQQVLSELDFVLNQKERLLQSNPYDKQSQTHVAVLHQLKKLVQTGVSQDELAQILGQLRTLAQPTQNAPPAPVAPAPPVAAVPPPVSQPYPPQATYPPPAPAPSNQYPVAQSIYPSQPAYPAPQSYAPPKPVPVAIPSSEPTASTSAPAPTALPVDVSSLFSALLKAGVVSSSSTPVGAGATAKDGTPVENSSVEANADYRQEILAVNIRLTSTDIVKQRPPIVKFLYDRLPSQCKQCGVRFPGDAAGKKKLQDHLDAHFRQNRKASQAAGRGLVA
ncbi:hypothetical protein NM688_g4281 [Phlebia brevispora]|uniref:Uncharacterized protein n=1 Tax=Phlebia brevispora TaxID=194682 RepID=A0ACC1T3I2_9APHY|nr:hypothetical protein NM688_g4281 [Phlebia brevispora]